MKHKSISYLHNYHSLQKNVILVLRFVKYSKALEDINIIVFFFTAKMQEPNQKPMNLANINVF